MNRLIYFLIVYLALILYVNAGGRLIKPSGGGKPAKVDMPMVGGLPLQITQYGLDLIVHFEVGGKAYYSKVYHRPIWPKGASGVTIGIGYDLGYNTRAQIEADWKPYVNAKTLALLKSCAGIKGWKARSHAQRLKYQVSIPLDAAMKVFSKRTVPRFALLTKKTFPGIENAHPFIQDAMTSQSFNRGTSVKGHSRRHVLWQQQAAKRGEYQKLPQLIRDSKVVWANKHSIRRGIWRRRDTEADHGEGKGQFIPLAHRLK